MWLVMGLSMIAVVVTSLIALVQNDMKKLIAYSSVAHMAFVTIGLFAFNRQGIEGALMVMLGHGLVSGALITETIFAWPGMGRLFWEASGRVDYPVLMGIFTVASTLVIASNLLADVAYAWLDPRIRYR